MDTRIVQVNFKFGGPVEEFVQLAASFAEAFAAVPGLAWKIWLLNESEREAGGVYLFEDEAAAQAYLDGPLVTALKTSPTFFDVRIKQFGIVADATAITRGPVSAGLSVAGV